MNMGLHLYDTAQRSAWLVKHADFSQGLKRQTCCGGTDSTMESPKYEKQRNDYRYGTLSVTKKILVNFEMAQSFVVLKLDVQLFCTRSQNKALPIRNEFQIIST